MAHGYVVFDTDMGTDDAWGLLMLAKAEYNAQTPAHGGTSYKILGVTTVQGNTDVDNATTNALRVLQAMDRKDIPVYKGCGQPLIPRRFPRTSFFHGRDGFGDLQHPEPVDTTQLRSEHAVNAMYNFVCKYPNMVDFILVGPLTNFAMCINMYGEDFLNKLRNVHIMGGNYKGKGNDFASSEFNFMMDPESVDVVFRLVKTPITILPWETIFDEDMDLTFKWRMEILGSANSKIMQLLSRVEKAIFTPKQFIKWIVCDASLVSTYIFPQLTIEKSLSYNVNIELNGRLTRGQMCLDHLRENPENANIIALINKENHKHILAWTAGLPNVEMITPSGCNCKH